VGIVIEGGVVLNAGAKVDWDEEFADEEEEEAGNVNGGAHEDDEEDNDEFTVWLDEVAEKEARETIFARKGLWTTGARDEDNISSLGSSFGSYFSWISSRRLESSSKILRRPEPPNRVLTISDGPEGVVDEAPSEFVDVIVNKVVDDDVTLTPPLPPPPVTDDGSGGGNIPAEGGAEAWAISGEGSGEAIGDEMLKRPPVEDGSNGVDSRRFRMRNLV
jgi:hypothetical protein